MGQGTRTVRVGADGTMRPAASGSKPAKPKKKKKKQATKPADEDWFDE